MLIDGEKYACSSCIKGHRVSGCMHSDRELHHINPKGRPVKQCEHCRGARKSKSHHAKCDCGEKKDKDKHKDKGDAKGMEHVDARRPEDINAVADAEGRCCCHSGGKCICGMKESHDLKLDTGKQTLHAARTKPKLTSTQSESTLTVFANGHHKPCHRNNNTAHVSGAPYSYKLGRPHTLHGSAAFASYTQGSMPQNKPENVAPRAVDTHSLSNNDFYTFLGSSQRSVNGLAVAPLTSSYDSTTFADSLFGQSTFGQEGNSPGDSPLADTLSTPQWAWSSNTVTPLNRNFGFGSLSTSPSQDCLPNLDNDWAIPSAGLHNPLWSAGDLPLDPSKLSDTLGQPLSNPGLTNGSSSHSEVGEPTLFGDLDFKTAPSTMGDLEFKPPQSAVSETLFWEDSPAFRMAPSTLNEVPSAPTSAPSSSASPDNQGLEMDFVRGFGTDTMAMNGTSNGSKGAATTFPGSAFGEPGAIAIPNSIDDMEPSEPWLPDFDLADFKSNYPFNWT